MQFLRSLFSLFLKKIQKILILLKFQTVIHSIFGFDSKKQQDCKTYQNQSALYLDNQASFPSHQEDPITYVSRSGRLVQFVPVEELRNTRATTSQCSDNHEKLRQWYLESLRGARNFESLLKNPDKPQD